MTSHPRTVRIEDYEPFVGRKMVARVRDKAQALQGLHVAHINSTYYGGGVAELLSSLTLLMNGAGIKTGWRIIQGAPDFFSITKKMHNALQGAEINLSDRKKEIYEEIIYENVIRNHLDHHNFIFIHDPQPLPMIRHYQRNGPWVWQCHIDLTRPDPGMWNYLRPFVEHYDAAVFSLEDYRRELETPQVFFMPAINPFSIKNHQLDDEEYRERFEHYGIPTDLPLVVQVSRFDRWKDPEGVIRAFKLARKEIPCRLVLLGNVATDDPEGHEVYRALLDERSDEILIFELPGHGPRQRAAVPGRRRGAEIPAGGVRAHGDRGHVEGRRRDRGRRGRHPLPDRGRRQRLSRRFRRTDRRADRPAPARREAPGAPGQGGARDREEEVPDDPLSRGLPRPDRLLRDDLPLPAGSGMRRQKEEQDDAALLHGGTVHLLDPAALGEQGPVAAVFRY